MNDLIMELEWSCGKYLWRWSGGGGRILGALISIFKI
jgi:hypothetical protein